MIKGKNILVTGGAGFIGSNLVETLLRLENKVVCLDNFSTGKLKNIEPFFNDKNFLLIEGDIRDLDTCKKAVKGVDYVLHEAALGSVPRSINDPITTNEVNISLSMCPENRKATTDNRRDTGTGQQSASRQTPTGQGREE